MPDQILPKVYEMLSPTWTDVLTPTLLGLILTCQFAHMYFVMLPHMKKSNECFDSLLEITKALVKALHLDGNGVQWPAGTLLDTLRGLRESIDAINKKVESIDRRISK